MNLILRSTSSSNKRSASFSNDTSTGGNGGVLTLVSNCGSITGWSVPLVRNIGIYVFRDSVSIASDTEITIILGPAAI